MGEDRVVSYFRALSAGTAFGWQDPFRSTFGMDPAQFYLEFATQFAEVKYQVACPTAWYEPGGGEAHPVEEECRTISGTVTDLQGRPRSGILVDVSPPSRNGGDTPTASVVTGADGQFSLVVPGGTYVLGLRADFRSAGTSTGGRSYFGGSTGFTNDYFQANSINVETGNSGHIQIASAAVSGMVRSRNQEPLKGMTVFLVRPSPTNPFTIGGTEVPYRWVTPASRPTEESGEFRRLVEPGTFKIAVFCGENSVSGTFVGWFAGERGLASAVAEASEIVVGSADVTGIAIDVPFYACGSEGTVVLCLSTSNAPLRTLATSHFQGLRQPSTRAAGSSRCPASALRCLTCPRRRSLDRQDETRSPLDDAEDADGPQDETYVPPRIEFVMDVTPEHKDEVRALVDDVVDFFHQRLGVRASGLTIRYGDLSIFVCGIYEPEIHTITMAHPGRCFGLIPHEYVHALQGQLRERTHLGPPWIVEGSADYWAAVYYDATGGDDYVTQFQSVVRYARNIGFIPTGSDYSVGHMGVHYLVKQFGEKALAAYFRDPLDPARDGWNSEFEDAFGIGLNQFYRNFAGELTLLGDDVACPVSWYAPGRAEGDEPAEDCRRVEGTVTDLEGAPRSGVYVEATTERHGRYFLDGTAFDATDDDGQFALALPSGSYRVVACIPGPSHVGSPCNGTTLHRPGYVRGQDINLQFRDRTGVGISPGIDFRQGGWERRRTNWEHATGAVGRSGRRL